MKSLYNGMKAEVTFDRATTPQIEVTNGLRQGVYYRSYSLQSVLQQCSIAVATEVSLFGMQVLYKCGGKLVGEMRGHDNSY